MGWKWWCYLKVGLCEWGYLCIPWNRPGNLPTVVWWYTWAILYPPLLLNFQNFPSLFVVASVVTAAGRDIDFNTCLFTSRVLLLHPHKTYTKKLEELAPPPYIWGHLKGMNIFISVHIMPCISILVIIMEESASIYSTSIYSLRRIDYLKLFSDCTGQYPPTVEWMAFVSVYGLESRGAVVGVFVGWEGTSEMTQQIPPWFAAVSL